MDERFKNFTLLMSSINRSIKRIKSEEMAAFDLKSPHLSCLYYLYKKNTLTSKELCDICEEDKANISRSIDYLETNGYLLCHSSSRKRYKSRFELTERGREVAKMIAERIDRIMDALAALMSEEHREIMYECLSTVSEELQSLCARYKPVADGAPSI